METGLTTPIGGDHRARQSTVGRNPHEPWLLGDQADVEWHVAKAPVDAEEQGYLVLVAFDALLLVNGNILALVGLQ